jgi:hypothetical protein
MGPSSRPRERRPARATVRRALEDYATGRYTKEQLLKRARNWDLGNRRAKPLTSQAIGMPLREGAEIYRENLGVIGRAR